MEDEENKDEGDTVFTIGRTKRDLERRRSMCRGVEGNE